MLVGYILLEKETSCCRASYVKTCMARRARILPSLMNPKRTMYIYSIKRNKPIYIMTGKESAVYYNNTST